MFIHASMMSIFLVAMTKKETKQQLLRINCLVSLILDENSYFCNTHLIDLMIFRMMRHPVSYIISGNIYGQSSVVPISVPCVPIIVQ